MSERWVRAAAHGDVERGKSLAVTVEGWELALHSVEGRLYCTTNVCPHQGRPLAGGVLEGTRLTCPWHAWIFDVTTGEAPFNPFARIPCLPVKVEGDDILVGFPERSKEGIP
jgi:nitrite reductase (NADH) small subunit